MRRIALGTALILLMTLTLGSLAAAAPPSMTDGEQDPLAASLTVRWQDSNLKEVFATIFRAINADYVIADDVSGKSITMQREASARDILEHVCASQGLHWWKNGQAYVISSHPAPQEGSVTPAPAEALSADSRAKSVMKLRSYKSQYWNPLDLANMFGSREGMSSEGRAWRPELTAFYSGDLGTGQSADTSLQPFGFGRSRLGEARQYPVSGPERYRDQSALPLATAARRPTATRPTTTTGLPGITSLQGDQISTEEQALLEAGIDINAPFAALLPSGMTAPIAFEPLNLLIFEATDEAYDRFLELLRIFDQKPKQVLLDVQFVTMNTTDAYALGVNWNYSVGRTLINVDSLAPQGYVNIGIGNGSTFGAQLSALLTNSRARLVSAPRLATMNNFSASITLSEEVPYVNFGGAAAVPNGGIIEGGAELQTITVPTQLTMTPRINADDSITVLLTPTITNYRLVEVPTSATSGGTQLVPLTSTSQVVTVLNIKDGETMVMGGFISRSDSTNKSKIPLLSELPILGDLLFTRTTVSNEDSELLIFVTPHVMKDDTETATVGPY